MLTDDVSGIIVGGNFGAAWVTYDGKKQGRTVYASNRHDADKMLFDFIDGLKSDLGEHFKYIFPKQLWAFNYDGI